MGPGWYGNASHHRVVGPSAVASKEEAWARLLEAMCLTSPGHLILSSCEFGSVYLGEAERRSRLEIRKIADEYQVLHVERVYPSKKAPYDVSQMRLGYGKEVYSFKDVGAAANHVNQYVFGYCNAEKEALEDALEHQSEEDLEERRSDLASPSCR